MSQIILVEKSAVIAATPARVYKSLIEAKQLSRWLADRVESDPRQGGKITIAYDTHQKRGEYRRLIPGVEVGISWTQFEGPIPIDITAFKLDKVARGTRVRVVECALPENAAELQSLWVQRLKRLKKLYPARQAVKKSTPKKKLAVKHKTMKRQTTTPKAAARSARKK